MALTAALGGNVARVRDAAHLTEPCARYSDRVSETLSFERPVPYTRPADGPVGRILESTGRSSPVPPIKKTPASAGFCRSGEGLGLAAVAL